MKKEKEVLYNKINPKLNSIIGRLTMLRNSEIGREAHIIALQIADILDDWINE